MIQLPENFLNYITTSKTCDIKYFYRNKLIEKHFLSGVTTIPNLSMVGRLLVKAVLLQACAGPDGSRRSRLPDFLTKAHEGGRLSAVRTGRVYPPGKIPGTVSVRGGLCQ
jgi:hypothetical protein